MSIASRSIRPNPDQQTPSVGVVIAVVVISAIAGVLIGAWLRLG